MILDNREIYKDNKYSAVHEFLTHYIKKGKGDIDIVSGYFTVGALAYLKDLIEPESDNEDTRKLRFILSEFVPQKDIQHRTIDLLNEDFSVENVLHLSSVAKKAITLLESEQTEIKTIEPNFCHSKLFLQHVDEEAFNLYIAGSSNLTESGLGLKPSSNIELNLAGTGDSDHYKSLKKWFKNLWKDATNDDFKKVIIEKIKSIYINHTPEELYYKILIELFGDQIIPEWTDPDFSKNIESLQGSKIFNLLYSFQKVGVFQLITMLNEYNGAILADAVGLGKTWSALAVMKYYQSKGREILLLCPKKLEMNWLRYKFKQESIFEKDKLDFSIRFHTDLSEERMNTKEDRADKTFTNGNPKLIVIDESHNLRNHKSKRYKFLLEEIIRKNRDVKVLMLSATPINNSFNDLRNQFMLIAKTVDGFRESLNIDNLETTFRGVNTEFNRWKKEDDATLQSLIEELPPEFRKLKDNLIIARTRKMINSNLPEIEKFKFPEKSRFENIFMQKPYFPEFFTLDDLLNALPPMLSAYQPAFFNETKEDSDSKFKERNKEEYDVLKDDVLREHFLVKMMTFMMLKRLESSWYSFFKTIKNILKYHNSVSTKIKEYETNKERNIKIKEALPDDPNDEDDELEEYIVGKKEISIADIDSKGNLDLFKKKLKEDIRHLNNLHNVLERFESDINNEEANESKDEKLEKLISNIQEKQNCPFNENFGKKKILIFTTYSDTARYLFDELTRRGFKKLAMVTGSDNKVSLDIKISSTKSFEPILERFAPYTKLYLAKQWDGFAPKETQKLTPEAYNEWKKWIETSQEKTCKKASVILDNEVDILIATDCLSEGQNLQDADTVINYDIHWNPVRVIQRFGRIDRIGSPNEKIFGVNFWPTESVDEYLGLKSRVEKKMALMTLAGTERADFSDEFQEMVADNNMQLDDNNDALKQLDNVDITDIGSNLKVIGLDNISSPNALFKEDLWNKLKENQTEILNLPNGIYSGFKTNQANVTDTAMIALLGYPSRDQWKSGVSKYTKYRLVFIDMNGNEIFNKSNQEEILDFLRQHKGLSRAVPKGIDNNEHETIKGFSDALKAYLENAGNIKDILKDVREGNMTELAAPNNQYVDEHMGNLENYDLRAWIIVSK